MMDSPLEDYSRNKLNSTHGNLESELDHWKDVSRNSNDSEERRQARSFINAIEPITQELISLDSVRLSEFEDSAISILGLMDDLWKLDEYTYPQDRMERFLSVSGACFAEAITRKLQNASLWKEDSTQGQIHLDQALATCKVWNDECQQMTSFFWKNDAVHTWQGEAYQSVSVNKLRERINQINSIRQATALANQLLPSSKHYLMEINHLFQSFQELDTTIQNPLMDAASWKSATSQFNERFIPVEKEVISCLKELFFPAHNNDPTALLDIFLKYKELVQRPRIRRELEQEGQLLMDSTRIWLQSLRKSLPTTSNNNRHLENAEGPLEQMDSVRNVEKQVKNICTGIHLFVNEMEDAVRLEEEANALLSEIRESISDLFDAWSRSTLAGIRDQSLTLSSDAPVVTFDRNKLMRINYDSRLVEFVQDVNLLSSMGFKIAPQILKNSKVAQGFMQQAKDLEKIADFHNNIGDSIIPCLKPLMLEAARGLSALAQEQNVVKWTQPDTVDGYIRKLQTAVQRLGVLNHQLTNCHEQIQEKIVKLFDINLMSEQQKWRDVLREVRLIMGTVEAQGLTHSQAWRQYWDHQLYKALEYQYQSQLSEIHKNVSDIHIELDFKKQYLQYRPPLEDIRREYYLRLRKFLALPLNFKGFHDQPGPTIFAKIVDKHADRFVEVYAVSGKLFVELEQFKNRFECWVAPALVDVETYFDRQLKDPQDWDGAFQVAKKKQEESATLSSDDERIGCFFISLSPLQREIDYVHRRLWDALTSSLYTSVHKDALEIDTFTSNAAELLSYQQTSDVEEFAQANGNFTDLLRSTPEMERLMKRIESKMQVMTRWTKEHVDIYDQIKSKWTIFNDQLSQHKHLIHQQLDNLKASAQSQIIDFTSKVDQFHQQWLRLKPKDESIRRDEDEIDRYISTIQNAREEWDELMLIKVKMNNNLEKVGEKPVDLSLVAEIDEDIHKQERACHFYKSIKDDLEAMGNEDWMNYRNKIAKFDEYWSQKLAEEEDLLTLFPWLKIQIDSFKELVPLLKLLRGETFTDRHWAEILQLVSLPSMPFERIKFRHFLQSRDTLAQHLTQIKEVNGRAAGESLVRQALAELEQWEIESRWTFSQHVDSNGVHLTIIKEFKELLNKVGENLSLIQSAKDSSYYQAYSDRIASWETKMTDLDFYLRLLSQIQLKWLYLEPVFNRGTLLKDAGRFRRLDADFRFILTEIRRDSHVSSILRISNVRSVITNLLDQVGRCQKSLYEFLESKRSQFARFYFLGDEDLLDIIGQASTKPWVIQPHLKKLFAGIHSVRFSSDGRSITSFASADDEEVPLKAAVPLTSEVETCLNQLVSESRSTLKHLLNECSGQRQQEGRPADLSRYPSQILCLAEAVVFSQRCERAISSGQLPSLKTEYQQQLAHYTGKVASSSGVKEDKVVGLKRQALIMDIIHYIDIIDQVLSTQCRSPDDWIWQKQLRFYIVNGSAVARMAGTEVEYTYEYQGNVSKLVHTPLTDKCYLTLTLALRMGLGGNPYGPAGTGKTESVKALGSLLGRQVLVFNCDEGLDVKSMGRIFIGLAKSGAWGCFDEFNRLDENTLSTVSTLIQAIQTSLKYHHQLVTILGSEIDISRHTGIFVTLNPAGKEYGGRQKLPDNLKLLFRPVVMSQPDNELIAEVILFSQGFRNAKTIGKKLVEIFRLSQ